MPRDSIDLDNLTVSGAHKVLTAPHLRVDDEVVVIVTHAFGPTGESLMGVGDVQFDGFPAITVGVRAAGRDELVHLSPIHGDRRKVGMDGLAPGTKCELYCPRSGKRLDAARHASEHGEADLFAIYLTPRLSQGELVAVSDVWDHYYSRVMNDFELISEWGPRRNQVTG